MIRSLETLAGLVNARLQIQIAPKTIRQSMPSIFNKNRLAGRASRA